MSDPIQNTTALPLLGALTDVDRVRMSEALQALLAHGSILGLEAGQYELYSWCRQNLEWLREVALIVGLHVANEHESRLIQASPLKSSLTLRLRQDATIVFLALWYEFDTQVREQGATEVRLTVEQLVRLLQEKLLPDLKEPPSRGRLLEILRLGQRYNLLRIEILTPFEESRIEILPSLRRVIPFQDFADWARTANLHKNAGLRDVEDESTETGGSTP